MTRTLCRVCDAPTNAYLCAACTTELARAVGDLTALRHEVSVLATGQTRVYRANGRPAPDQEAALSDAEHRDVPAWLRSRTGRVTLPATRMMIDERARTLLNDADNEIGTTVRHLVETRGLDLPDLDTARPGHTTDPILAAIGWLLTNLDAIRYDETAADIHHALTTLHLRMQRAVDRVPSRVYAGPCEAPLNDGSTCPRPLYETPQPVFDDPAERELWERDHPVVCDGWRPPFDRSDGWTPGDKGCGAEHSRESRRAWILADIEDRLLPWSLLQDALPGLARDLTWPSRATWFRWRSLIEVRMVFDGTEFYRGGDVVSRCAAEQGRIIGNRARAERTKSGAAPRRNGVS